MKKHRLYLECYSGISGDMFVAALLDLGADEARLKKVLETVPVHGFRVEIKRVVKSGLDACDFAVILDEEHENHDHDMEYLHGHEHHHEHEHEHHHEHEHEHHHGHHHEHRGLAEVLHIIEHTQMSDRAKDTAVRIFTILGRAEAKAHGTTPEQVHFHEVGAVDSIVDIISAAVCLDDLDIEETVIPVLYEGRGTIRCQHGILPIPVPATANIVSDSHLHLHISEVDGELVTPTGAAIAAAVRTSECLPEGFVIEKTGIGAGKRKYKCPGILRAMLIRDKIEVSTQSDKMWKLETNIDDCSGECLGYVMEQLLEAGARDVSYIPIFMKKNRPAYEMNIICAKEDIDRLEAIVFRETTTIGIRRIPVDRSILQRETRQINTSVGTAQVKICTAGENRYIYPEYDSVAALCKASGLSFQEVLRKVVSEGYEQL